MDVLALPTYREGFNTVLLEAAAMELAVVASRVPGCVDGVLEGETGALVPSHDAVALADALRVYLKDSALRRQHGLAGRVRVVRDFKPADMSEAIYQEYRRLMLDRCNLVAPVNNMTLYRRHGKRFLDIITAAIALMILGPMLLLLAVAVRIFLGALILFRQTRSGRGMKPFTILKFRTMSNACDATGKLLPDTQRLTRLGRFLRATSLDELPELLNVLKGEMSLVGPRPLLPQYDLYYSEQEARRFDLLPGITGWAQINGRNDLAWDDRLKCDVHYVDSYSFAFDLKILLLTVVKVLRRDNVQVDPDMTFGTLDDERRRNGYAASGKT